MLIYKIFRANEWATLRDNGVTSGAPIDLQDGYIHLSTDAQVAETAAKYFAGVEGLVLAACDTDQLGDAITWEPSRGGALFPHLYRDMALADVVFAEPLPIFDGQHRFGETIDGYIDPARPQFDHFKSLDRDQPIEMLNLVRLRETANYPTGHELAGQTVTGHDAYAAYGRETAPIIDKLGAEIIWRGAFDAMLIGPATEHWDHMFIARYPTAHAFLAMVTDPGYRSAVVHRQAAVLTSRLVRTSPLASGTSFA